MTQDTTAQRDAYRPQTVADELMARLRRKLFDGEFAPGEILSIRKIAQEVDVSVIPARDALRGLVVSGALAFRDSRTIIVPTLTPETLDEITFARDAVETELAARAFPALNGTCDDLAAIDRDVDAALLNGDVSRYMAANRALHFAIYRAARAPTLMRIAEELWLRIGPSMRFVCESLGGAIPASDYHADAIGALRGGDPDAFTAAIRADISQGISEIRNHILKSSSHTGDTQ